jgi:hypothetical protein
LINSIIVPLIVFRSAAINHLVAALIVGMKFFCILLFVFALNGCRPYKENTAFHSPVSDHLKKADHLKQLSNVRGLPRRIRKSEAFRYSDIRTDSSFFGGTQEDASLFRSGAYDEEEKCGYVIFSYKTKGVTEIHNVCRIFEVKGGALNSGDYNIPEGAFTWKAAMPYLELKNAKLFGGRIATEKEMRKIIRKAKRKKRKEKISVTFFPEPASASVFA